MSDFRDNWAPSCVGPVPGVKWRILKSDDGGSQWYHVECKDENGGQWEGGLSGTQEWLGLTDEECSRAYPRKGRRD